MLHEKVGKHGTRNRGRYQVAQSCLNRLYSSKNLNLHITSDDNQLVWHSDIKDAG